MEDKQTKWEPNNSKDYLRGSDVTSGGSRDTNKPPIPTKPTVLRGNVNSYNVGVDVIPHSNKHTNDGHQTNNNGTHKSCVDISPDDSDRLSPTPQLRFTGGGGGGPLRRKPVIHRHTRQINRRTQSSDAGKNETTLYNNQITTDNCEKSAKLADDVIHSTSVSGLDIIVNAPDDDDDDVTIDHLHKPARKQSLEDLYGYHSDEITVPPRKDLLRGVSSDKDILRVNTGREGRPLDSGLYSIEDNPSYRPFITSQDKRSSDNVYEDVEYFDVTKWLQSSMEAKQQEISDDADNVSNDVTPTYLDLLGDDDGGSTSTSDDEDEDEGEDDLYEYYWDSDEFSSVNDVYDDVDSGTYSRLLDKRKKVVEELVATEMAYVNKLLILFKTSLQIEGANTLKDLFAAHVTHQMFPSIEALYRLHSENILPAFKSRLEEWETKPYLSDLWRKYLPYLTMYKIYTTQFTEAVDLIQKHRKNSEDFASLLRKLEEKGEFRKLTVENYLLEPIQRIGRYKLLLQVYAKSLRSDEEERADIDDIIGKMEKQIQECQRFLADKDLFGDFQKVQGRLDDLLSVLNPQAKLLKEGGVIEVTTRNHHNQSQRYLFLFSDFLLVCARKLGGKFAVRLQLDIPELRVRTAVTLSDQGYSPDVTMLLKGQERTISLLFCDSKTKDDWEEVLLYAITNRMSEKLKRSNSRSVFVETGNCATFDRAPEWIPDDSAPSCMICEVKFKKLLKRRHHCRGCGIVVCVKCSTQKMALPYMNNNIARACDNCFVRGRHKKPELTRRVSCVIRKSSPHISLALEAKRHALSSLGGDIDKGESST